MKRILMTTAFSVLLASPAFADAHMNKFVTNADEMEVLGSEFLGARVYVVEKDLGEDYEYEDGAETEWDDIGDINEIVMTRDGELKAAVIGVGGLMGIGERDVAVKMDQFRFVSDGEDSSDYFIVFTSTLEELEAAPEWGEAERQAAAAERREEMRAEREDMRRAEYASDMDKLDSVKREGYAMVEADEVSADKLIGTLVYGTNDESVGEVGDLVLATGNGSKEAVINVGGFLGMGEKPVAIPMEELRIMKEEGGDEIRVYIDATQERLEKMPEYKM